MKVFNDLSRQKETLTPQTEGEYKVYVCGPTVYDFFHLGNARPFIIYDTLRRYLEYRGSKVIFVQNFTDIDDKIIRRANEEGITCQELSERMIKEYFVDAQGLNIQKATIHPRATECIPEIIDLIRTLEEKGYAYVLEDGVYYDTEKFADYGKLSHHTQEEEDGDRVSRVSHSSGKRSRNDFVLWKFKKEGEPFWPSPWGDGRPGWHIECSAMNKKYLGETIDIHGGGMDLIFPHHENEIAQSEAANDKPFVRYWMHNGFINVDNEKMSKSLGNFFTVRDLVKHFPYEVLRFFMLQAHYRMPINFSDELLRGAEAGWERIKACARGLAFRLEKAASGNGVGDAEAEALAAKACEAFIEGMEDDLNTADAIAAIFDLVRSLNSLLADQAELSKEAIRTGLETLTELCSVLGLEPLKTEKEGAPAEVEELVQARGLAKKEKRWADADALRARITELGWRVEDTPQGPRLLKA